MPMFIDAAGAQQQVELSPSLFREAHRAGLSARAYINQTYQTAAGQPSAFEQFCASEGLIAGSNGAFGIRPSTLESILEPKAGVITKEDVPASRILFPIFTMAAVENKLRDRDYGAVALFEGNAAVVDTIDQEMFQRPVLDFSKPEQARSKPIAQLSEPASLLSITASDKSWRITGTSLGMEIADQALKATTLDLVVLAFTRQAEVEGLERVEQKLLAFLQGDSDLDMAALSGSNVQTAQSYDSSVTVSGTLSQKAWVSWFFNKSRKRQINTVITDFAGALAIQNRTGRPTVQGDNGTSKRIEVTEEIINPQWPDRVRIMITMDPNWPANTILGFDRRYGYHVVNSTFLNYQAAEAYAIRRSTKYRIDSGSIAYRLFDEAWDVLSLVAS